jgi:hypothetical protein
MPGQTAVIDGYQHYRRISPSTAVGPRQERPGRTKEQPERSFSKGADFSTGRFNKVDACQGAEEWLGISQRHAGVSLEFSAVGEPDRRIQRVPPSHTLSRRKLEISFGLFQLPISERLLASLL